MNTAQQAVLAFVFTYVIADIFSLSTTQTFWVCSITTVSFIFPWLIDQIKNRLS